MGCILLMPDLLQSTYHVSEFSNDVGLWLPDRPLSNLKLEARNKQAWSIDAALHSTQFLVDLQTQRSIRGLAMPWGNFSEKATVTVDIYKDAALTDRTGGVTDSKVFRIIYPRSTTAFEDPEFWTGQMTAENRALISMPWFESFDTPVVGRYIHVQVKDTENPAGHLRLPRLFIASGFRPKYNMAPGSAIGVDDESVRVTTLGGGDRYSNGVKRAEFFVRLEALSDDEAMAKVFDTMKQYGIAGQGFFAWDTNDTNHRHRRSCMVTFENLDRLTTARLHIGPTNAFSINLKLREVVA